MSAVAAPLFTAERAGRRLRAFAAEGSAPELPWLALADLAAALTDARADEVELLAGLARGALGLQLRKAIMAEGRAVLVDGPSAFRLLAMIACMADGPEAVDEVRALHEDSEVGGLVAAVRHLPEAEARRWMDDAWAASAAACRAEAARLRSDLAGAAARGHGSGVVRP